MNTHEFSKSSKSFMNRNRFQISILFVILFSQMTLIADSQKFIEVKITKILDCNLFETKDGRLVQLANVEAPVMEEADSTIIRFAQHIKLYAKENILYSPLKMVISDSSEIIFKVHLFRDYDLQLFNFNEYYLKYGFGFYRQDPRSEYSEKYFKAAQTACEKRYGLWGKGIYQPIQNSFYGRWQIMGGFLGNLSDKKHDIESIPMINLNYRASKIITLFENQSTFFSFASELGSTLIFLNYFMGGPEIRIKKKMYFTANYGKFIFLIFGQNNYWSFINGCMGVILYNSGINIEIGYTKLYPSDEGIDIFHAGFVIQMR